MTACIQLPPGRSLTIIHRNCTIMKFPASISNLSDEQIVRFFAWATGSDKRPTYLQAAKWYRDNFGSKPPALEILLLLNAAHSRRANERQRIVSSLWPREVSVLKKDDAVDRDVYSNRPLSPGTWLTAWPYAAKARPFPRIDRRSRTGLGCRYSPHS